ncbi:hypothetical protein Leryth_008924 [Lithospermum erythrorhizon]|nr:hypothetical protein Leryth_008924 [Lithospermum erythrorhizon]
MDLKEESARFGSLPITTSRNLSSSSSQFYSANQSPFFSPKSPPSRLAINSGKPCFGTHTNMDPLDINSKVAEPFIDVVNAPRTSNNLQKLDPASSSTCISSYTLSNFGVDHEYDSPGHKGRHRKFGRLYEKSETPVSTSLSSNRLRGCDVFIGFHGSKPLLLRFTNWLRAELEVQGLSCFVTDRARCRNPL